VFAWLIADGDMHLKNMALLKISQAGDKSFRSVRVAPLYDVVTTRVFPRLEQDRMALKLNGKDDNLSGRDFRAFASTVGLTVSEAEGAIDAVVQRLRDAVERIELPAIGAAGELEATLDQVRALIRERIDRFA
jgi:serine/threonine-protein kinase HipA